MLTMELLNLHSTPKLQQPRLKVTLLQPPACAGKATFAVGIKVDPLHEAGNFSGTKKMKKKHITYSYYLTNPPHVFEWNSMTIMKLYSKSSLLPNQMTPSLPENGGEIIAASRSALFRGWGRLNEKPPWVLIQFVDVGKSDKNPTVSQNLEEVSNVKRIFIWLVVSTHLKNISQNGNLPQIRGENKTSLKPPPSLWHSMGHPDFRSGSRIRKFHGFWNNPCKKLGRSSSPIYYIQ